MTRTTTDLRRDEELVLCALETDEAKAIGEVMARTGLERRVVLDVLDALAADGLVTRVASAWVRRGR